LHQHASAGVARIITDFEQIAPKEAERKADPVQQVGFFVEIGDIVPEG